MRCDGQRPSCDVCQPLQVNCVYDLDRRQASRVSKETVEAMGHKVATLEQTLAELRAKGNLDDPRQSGLEPGFQTVASPLRQSNPAAPAPREDGQDDLSNLTRQSEIQVHSLVSSDTGVSVHGPTSTFTGPHLPNVVADSPASARHNQYEREEIRQRLFAYSALQLQKEFTLLAQPKLDLDGVDWQTATHLLDLHWNHQHLGFLLTYRPAIMDSLANGGPHCNKLLLNAIFYTSALQSNRPNMRDDPAKPDNFGSRRFRRFQELLGTEIQNSSPTSIAGLIAMGSSCVSNGRQTIGWLFAGIAYRMIVDLGMNLDPDKVQMSNISFSNPSMALSEIDHEIRRRYTWAAYLNDRVQSLYFGRPPNLDMTPKLSPSQTLLDTYEELDVWRPYVDPEDPEPSPVSGFVPQPKYAVSTWNALLKLAEITSEVVVRLYTPTRRTMTVESAHHDIEAVQRQLNQWADSLAPHLRYEPGHLPVPPPNRFIIQ